MAKGGGTTRSGSSRNPRGLGSGRSSSFGKQANDYISSIQQRMSDPNLSFLLTPDARNRANETIASVREAIDFEKTHKKGDNIQIIGNGVDLPINVQYESMRMSENGPQIGYTYVLDGNRTQVFWGDYWKLRRG